MSFLRFYALLLHLLPRGFRDRYGGEMAALVERRLDRAPNRPARLRVALRSTADALYSALILRLPGRRYRAAETGPGALSRTPAQRLDMFFTDLRHAAQKLLRSPGFTVGASLLLAVGIAANTTVFAVVDAFLFRPPPWEDADRVVRVYQDDDDGAPSSSSFPATRDMAESPVFSHVAATTPSSATLEGPDGPTELTTEYVTSPLLDVLGRSPLRGRFFDAGHDRVGSQMAAVVTASAWRERFGSDPGIVGRTLTLNGMPVTVIGVGPEGVAGSYPPLRTDLWLSISSTPVTGEFQVANLDRRQDHWYDVFARLAPEVTPEQAQSAMTGLAGQLAEAFPALNRGREITVFPAAEVRIHPGVDGDLRAGGSLVLALVFVVLLLACANLANLMLMRGLGRSGEVAVRAALGAGRGRLARLFVLEAGLLAAVGGILGLALTTWGIRAVGALPLPGALSGPMDIGITGRVLVFLAAVLVFTVVASGLAPAFRAGRGRLAALLRDDAAGTSGSATARRLRNGLVVVQVAASVVLLVGTGLLARSFAQLSASDRGVDADRVAWVQLDWARSGLSDSEVRAALPGIVERVAAAPGATAAAFTTVLPAQPVWSTTTEVEGYQPATGTDAVEFPFTVVTDDYFTVMGLDVLRGRTFGADEVPDGDWSLVLNEEAVRRFYGDGDPLGRRMRGQGGEEWSRSVVGVVPRAPVRSLDEPPTPMFYLSVRQIGAVPGYLVVRTSGDPAALLPAIRSQLARTGIEVPVRDQGTLTGHFGQGLAAPRMAAQAMGAFSLLALVLAGMGIYAVVGFSVRRRTAELGIRIALGARRTRVIRMVLGEVVGVVALGLVLGLAGGIVTARALESGLYGVAALDLPSLAGAVLLLGAVATLAAYLPARRATASDPVKALRAT